MDSLFYDFSLFKIWGPLWLILLCWVGFLYKKHIIDSAEYEVKLGQKGLFFAGLILLYLLHGSPFSIIADYYLFSALMLQLALTYFVIVPFLIVGLPMKLFKKYAWNHKLRISMKIAGHPWLTLITFNALLTIFFIPSVFNFVHASILLSFTFKFVLFIYAFFMWWTIISPVRRLNEIAPLARIAFIFLASLALMPIGFFFLLVLVAHYPTYQNTAGEIFPVMTAVYDQQLAGGLLKFIQIASFVYAMFKIVQAWGREIEEQEGETLDKNLRVVQGVVIRVNNDEK